MKVNLAGRKERFAIGESFPCVSVFVADLELLLSCNYVVLEVRAAFGSLPRYLNTHVYPMNLYFAVQLELINCR